MNHSSRRLAAYVEPDIDERRIDRVWAQVSSHPARTWPRWRLAALPAFSVAAGVAAALLVVHARTSSQEMKGVVVESGPGPVVTLPDGSRATVHDGARLRWDRVQSDRVEATVERGPVEFDVRHEEARAFVVHAGGVDLVDRGTRFAVDVEGAGVTVSVSDGRVEVMRAGAHQATLVGGESWTSGTVGALAPSAIVAPAANASEAPPPSAPPEVVAPTAPKPASPEPHVVTAQELLQTANDARLAGHPKDAAVAFDTLRRRFRGDARAGLAAFELGRLRLDALGDPAGAAEALSDAISLAPGAPFREDADARLVEAFDRMHDTGRCGAARKAYLARYPGGLHAAAVTARCP
jgi:transmembrane sensor